MKLETRNQKHKSKRREQAMLYAPLFIWIAVIFILSSSQGSMNRTSLIVRPILEFLFPLASEQTLLLYHGYIRKFAHFAEYAVLGILACRAFIASPRTSLRKYYSVTALVVVVLVAVADETNQSFNTERTGSPVDALIDVSGGIAGTLVYYILKRFRRRAPSAAV